MDKRFLSYYREELQYIRELAAEFARANPKIAGRLALSTDGKEECGDPFVERLLEGFAFLTARIQLKYDSEYSRATQALLDTLYPGFLAPLPSMGTVRFSPDFDESGLAGGYIIPRKTALRSRLGKGERTACVFSTAHEVTLWPIQIQTCSYHSRDLGVLLPGGMRGTQAAIRIRLRSTAGLTFSQIEASSLDFLIRGTEDFPALIYEQIFSRLTGVVVRGVGRDATSMFLPPETISPVGFENEEALLPPTPRGFEGYRLLREYFAFPERFFYFRSSRLEECFSDIDGSEAEVLLLLSEQQPRLDGRIDEDTFALFCTPVINLFRRKTDRIQLSDANSEYPVIVDKTRTLDYEVYSIEEVVGYGTLADEVVRFSPFYMVRDDEVSRARAFFTQRRAPRLQTAREKTFGRDSSYLGSDVFLSLVDMDSSPYARFLQQLSVTTLCTNRHLPMQMATGNRMGDFTCELGGPFASIQCLNGPTSPRPSPADGEFSWRLISHLNLNYISLESNQEKGGGSALREIIRLQCLEDDLVARAQVDGIQDVRTKPVVRRVHSPGPVAFARGLEVSILFDESKFEGTGAFVLAAVLERFMRKYVAINSFTEMVMESVQRGVVHRWQAQPGKNPIF